MFAKLWRGYYYFACFFYKSFFSNNSNKKKLKNYSKELFGTNKNTIQVR